MHARALLVSLLVAFLALLDALELFFLLLFAIEGGALDVVAACAEGTGHAVELRLFGSGYGVSVGGLEGFCVRSEYSEVG